MNIDIDIPSQTLALQDNGNLIKEYIISSAANGVGEEQGSEQTPRGLHKVRAKIGVNCAENAVFVGRRPTGELYSPHLRHQYPTRDWILTRIFWLSGLEPGKNRFGQVDTMRRYI